MIEHEDGFQVEPSDHYSARLRREAWRVRYSETRVSPGYPTKSLAVRHLLTARRGERARLERNDGAGWYDPDAIELEDGVLAGGDS